MNNTNKLALNALKAAKSEMRDWHFEHPVIKQIDAAITIIEAVQEPVGTLEIWTEGTSSYMQYDLAIKAETLKALGDGVHDVFATPHCPHCNGTGNVHRADGEWLGECMCVWNSNPEPAPGWKPIETAAVQVAWITYAHKSNTTIRFRQLAANPVPNWATDIQPEKPFATPQQAAPTSDDQFDRLNAEAQKAVALLATVIEQRDRLAADAARYQWLRSNPEWLGWEHDFRPDEVEREIDAAMKAKP